MVLVLTREYDSSSTDFHSVHEISILINTKALSLFLPTLTHKTIESPVYSHQLFNYSHRMNSSNTLTILINEMCPSKAILNSENT